MATGLPKAVEVENSRCGVGLGLRWDFLDEVLESDDFPVAFWEISPENYMRRGGYFPAALERLTDQYHFVTHGLTMGVGAIDPPTDRYIDDISSEIARVRSPWHSDHLCMSSAGPIVLHELLPMPMTHSGVRRAADRIRSVQDKLGCPFAFENVSFYAHPVPPQMSEQDFLCEILRLSEAKILLDINNVYVNAVNHGYDPLKYIQALPHDQVIQLHIAGHTSVPDTHGAAPMLLDTHGADVAASVKQLFRETLKLVGPVPVLLERDNDIPPLSRLLEEVAELQVIYEETLSTPKSEVAVP